MKILLILILIFTMQSPWKKAKVKKKLSPKSSVMVTYTTAKSFAQQWLK